MPRSSAHHSCSLAHPSKLNKLIPSPSPSIAHLSLSFSPPHFHHESFLAPSPDSPNHSFLLFNHPPAPLNLNTSRPGTQHLSSSLSQPACQTIPLADPDASDTIGSVSDLIVPSPSSKPSPVQECPRSSLSPVRVLADDSQESPRRTPLPRSLAPPTPVSRRIARPETGLSTWSFCSSADRPSRPTQPNPFQKSSTDLINHSSHTPSTFPSQKRGLSHRIHQAWTPDPEAQIPGTKALRQLGIEQFCHRASTSAHVATSTKEPWQPEMSWNLATRIKQSLADRSFFATPGPTCLPTLAFNSESPESSIDESIEDSPSWTWLPTAGAVPDSDTDEPGTLNKNIHEREVELVNQFHRLISRRRLRHKLVGTIVPHSGIRANRSEDSHDVFYDAHEGTLNHMESLPDSCET